KDFFGTSDPYVRVKAGKHHAKTGYIKGTTNPVFNETLSLPIDEGTQVIYLDLYDKDIISDDFLARTSFRIDELARGSFETWVGLVDKKSRLAGELHVAIEPHFG
ncbi:hypothetical protein HMI56_003786, partial [Coelomomyces lativittatus]